MVCTHQSAVQSSLKKTTLFVHLRRHRRKNEISAVWRWNSALHMHSVSGRIHRDRHDQTRSRCTNTLFDVERAMSQRCRTLPSPKRRDQTDDNLVDRTADQGLDFQRVTRGPVEGWRAARLDLNNIRLFHWPWRVDLYSFNAVRLATSRRRRPYASCCQA